MSLSHRRVAQPRAAGILALGLALAALSACHHRSSAINEPSPAQQTQAGPAQRSGDDLVPRRFPGVDVVRTRSGGFWVAIHSGLVGPREPLYVLDGAPVAVDRTRGIDWVKLEDVVQIKVLKDPSETTVYGPRGANGVIVITTKQAATARRRGR